MRTRCSALFHSTILILTMGISSPVFAFTSQDESQNPSVDVPKVCTLTTTVAAGNVHVSEILTPQTSVTAEGTDKLPDGIYNETMVIRFADI